MSTSDSSNYSLDVKIYLLGSMFSEKTLSSLISACKACCQAYQEAPSGISTQVTIQGQAGGLGRLTRVLGPRHVEVMFCSPPSSAEEQWLVACSSKSPIPHPQPGVMREETRAANMTDDRKSEVLRLIRSSHEQILRAVVDVTRMAEQFSSCWRPQNAAPGYRDLLGQHAKLEETQPLIPQKTYLEAST